MRRHSAVVMAIGFSRKTCLPAPNAASASSVWVSCVVAMETASTSGSAKTSAGSSVARPPYSPCSARAASSRRSQKARTATPAVSAAPRAWLRPAPPQPISAQPTGAACA